jgi:hypothetical protein
MGAFFVEAQNNPTRAKTVSRTSAVLFIGGSLSVLDFDAGGSICPALRIATVTFCGKGLFL